MCIKMIEDVYWKPGNIVSIEALAYKISNCTFMLSNLFCFCLFYYCYVSENDKIETLSIGFIKWPGRICLSLNLGQSLSFFEIKIPYIREMFTLSRKHEIHSGERVQSHTSQLVAI